VANAKIIEQKAGVVSEIKEKFENAKSVVAFDYRGLSVAEVTELRRKLREAGADYKV
jgi:large subunit ribosomal protein L10